MLYIVNIVLSIGLMSLFAVWFSIDTKNGRYIRAFFDAFVVLWGLVYLMVTVISFCIGVKL